MKGDGWAASGLCAQTDPALFFPEKGDKNHDAKKVCAVCEVQPECLTWALGQDAEAVFGIWGGTTQNERRQLKRKAAA